MFYRSDFGLVGRAQVYFLEMLDGFRVGKGQVGGRRKIAGVRVVVAVVAVRRAFMEEVKAGVDCRGRDGVVVKGEGAVVGMLK